MAIGIGEEGAVSPSNLAAISGPDGWQPGDTSLSNFDYATTSWDSLADLLGNFARSLSCEATVTVTKRVEDAEGSVSGSGFDFILGQVGTGQIVDGTSRTTGDDGTAAWSVAFDDRDAQSTVTLTETPRAGYTLTDASCTVDGRPAEAIIDGTAITVQTAASVGSAVACDVTNRRDATPVEPLPVPLTGGHGLALTLAVGVAAAGGAVALRLRRH